MSPSTSSRRRESEDGMCSTSARRFFHRRTACHRQSSPYGTHVASITYRTRVDTRQGASRASANSVMSCLRGLDLNQRPLGYELPHASNRLTGWRSSVFRSRHIAARRATQTRPGKSVGLMQCDDIKLTRILSGCGSGLGPPKTLAARQAGRPGSPFRIRDAQPPANRTHSRRMLCLVLRCIV